MSSYTWPEMGSGSGSAGVSSLNTLTGDLILAAGTGITITPSGGNILTIDATGGGTGTVTSVGYSVPASSIFGSTGSPVTVSGTLGLTVTGTSGGIPYFDTTSTLNSSAALTANGIVLGGGAGAAPVVLGSLGTTTTLLHGNAAGAPTFGAVVTNDISASAVTNAKLANMADQTIKGNVSGGAAAPSDLTATQATSILNAFVGDSGAGGTKGLVPAPASGDAAANKFLKADGTWATTPSGSGTVSSVGLSVPAASILSVSGSPVTTSGTLGLLTTGTSGGIPYFSSTSQLSSSALLIANAIILGGGAATTPVSLGSLGTTTTVLHGNAAGAPTFGAVSLTADVSGTLPIGSGGTGQTTKAPAFDALSPMSASGDIIYGGTSGTGTRLPKGSDTQVLTLVSGLPAWSSSSSTMTSWASYTLTVGATVTPPTFGTTTVNIARWRRIGQNMEIYYEIVSTAAGSGGSGTYLFPIPATFAMDTGLITPSTLGTQAGVGWAYGAINTVVNGTGVVTAYNTTTLAMILVTDTGNNLVGSGFFNTTNSNGLNLSFGASIPISGW